MATTTLEAVTTRPPSVRTRQGEPASTPSANVPSYIRAPLASRPRTSPCRNLTGWNSAWSAKRTAAATGKGRSVSSTSDGRQPGPARRPDLRLELLAVVGATPSR